MLHPRIGVFEVKLNEERCSLFPKQANQILMLI
jgi:hypothetical protein